MPTLFDARYAAVLRREASQNGVFLTCVTTTRIYCLPSCHARTPLPRNVIFVETEVEAAELGCRACKRCRPDQFYAARGLA